MKNIFKNIVLFIITLESKAIIKKHKPFIIGVTGNLGKTSTKDIIFEVLKNNPECLLVRKTEKSLNSEYGVPLTIIGSKSGWNSIFKWIDVIAKGAQVYFSKNYPKILILEIGADRPGDISSITKWLKFDIGVLTQFAEYPVHVENFNNDKSLLVREKRYLIENIKNDGKLIFNASCMDSVKMIEDAKAAKTLKNNIEIISFGKNLGDYDVSNIKNKYENRSVEAEVFITKESKIINLVCPNIWGDAAIWTSLPAIIIGDIFKIQTNTILESIQNSKRSLGRMNILNSEWGQTIVDDTYNSSPLAVKNGLDVLGEIKEKNPNVQTVAILADMMELGEYSVEAHRSIGDSVVKNKVDILFTVGTRSRNIKNRAMELFMVEDNIVEYDNSKMLAKDITNYCTDGTISPDAVIYVKGSQSMRMERVVAQILDRKVKVYDNLVRQEEEWKKR